MRAKDLSIVYGRHIIDVRVLYADRTTLEIAVHPDRSVVVKAPRGKTSEEIRKRIDGRARWIVNQIDYFKQFEPKTPSRRYVGGETHLYLGKRYRLKIEGAEINCVRLSRGYFRIMIAGEVAPHRVKELLDTWYLEKARIKFHERLEVWRRFAETSRTMPRLQIKRMSKRWGSLSKQGALTLNADLIRAPMECIDYVIVHELCHLRHSNHGAEFYRLLESFLPGWEKRKHRLELTLL